MVYMYHNSLSLKNGDDLLIVKHDMLMFKQQNWILSSYLLPYEDSLENA